MIADVDNPLVPGLFAGSRDAALAFAKYINGSCAAKNKCLAGRKWFCDFYDPHLNVSETRKDEILCLSPMISPWSGLTLVALESVADMRNCKDQAGARRPGIPDIPFLAGPLVQQCSDESFPMIPIGIRCATKDQHPQTYDSNVARGFYFLKKYGALHGIYLFSSDSKDGYDDEFVGDGGLRDVGGVGRGIRSDGDFAVSAGASSSERVHPVRGGDEDQGLELRPVRAARGPCTVELRKEAVLQSATEQVKVWDCSQLLRQEVPPRPAAPTSNTSTSRQALSPLLRPEGAEGQPDARHLRALHRPGQVDGSGIFAWRRGGLPRRGERRREGPRRQRPHPRQPPRRIERHSQLRCRRHDRPPSTSPVGRSPTATCSCRSGTDASSASQPTKPGTFDCNPKYVITRRLDLTVGGQGPQ